MESSIKKLVFSRAPESYQMEYSYVIPEARGSGVMLSLLEAHMRECVENCPAGTPMFMKAFKGNKVSVGFYELVGFVPVETKCSDDRCLEFFPDKTMVLMKYVPSEDDI